MTMIVFFIVKKTIDNVNNQGKVYFTLKIQDYEQNKKEEKKESKEEIVNDKKKENTDSLNKNVIYVDKKNDYEFDEIFKLTKIIDDKFSLDYKKIIKEFIDKNVDSREDKRYYKLKKMKDLINKENVYEVLTSDTEKIDNIRESLIKIDSSIFEEYLMYNASFSVLEFSNYIEVELSKVDPTIYVVVGDHNLNFNYIDERIVTTYNESIYRGLRIIYHNKMYDYSLS